MLEDENAGWNLPMPRSGIPSFYATPTFLEMAMGAMQFPSDWDCDAWLRCNDITTAEKLADLHYALHHRCSQGVFQVSKSSDREFKIPGECSTLTVPHNGMRQYI